MKTNKTQSPWLIAVFFLLTFFSAGGGTVESLVNYPTWLLLEDADFKAFHNALGPRIVLTMVLPYLASTVFNVLLFWHRPAQVPRWSVWVTVGLAVLGWVSTAAIQIPIQAQLSETGFSREAIKRLIATDLPLRTIPGFLRLGVAFWLLLRVMRPVDVRRAAVA